MNKTFVFMFLIFVFIGSVSAVGITPGRTTIDFTPNLERTVGITLLNSEQKDISLVISPQGELQDYIFPREITVQIGKDEVSREIYYDVRLPESLDSGLHTGGVAIIELPDNFVSTGEMSVGAAVAVLSQLRVNVPYPGKHAEAELNVLPKADGTYEFFVAVSSKGEFTLTSVKANIDVFDAADDLVSTVYTEEKSIEGGKRDDLRAVWDPRTAPPGKYKAVANVVWDEGVTTVEKDFSVGEKRLVLENIEVNNFKLGEIAKFEILVSNNWNEVVEGVYAEAVVYSDEGNVLASFKSPTADVSPGGKEQLLAFWDTAGVLEGDYETDLYLVYEKLKEPTRLTLEVYDDKIVIVGAGFYISGGITSGGGSLIYILVGVIAFLVVANVSWFVYLRKKLKKR